MLRKKQGVVFTLIFAPSILYFYSSLCLKLEFAPSTNTTEFQLKSKPKLILIYNPPSERPLYPYMSETSKFCPQCIFIGNSSLLELSDAVVFNGFTMTSRPPIVRPRPNQIWIWYRTEAPSINQVGRLPWVTSSYPHMFNWTMTYRRDSDIFVPYGRIISKAQMPVPPPNQLWPFIYNIAGVHYGNGNGGDLFQFQIPTVKDLENRKMAAWIVSHCRSPSGREDIAHELKKYISLDIYGDCEELKCGTPRRQNSSNGQINLTGIDDCRFEVSRKYKFYLGFENSNCEDYVTEKFFNTLYTEMVPIVYGSANYSNFAPKNSFINVADFSDMKSLADYLIFLDKHPEEYLKYFEWQKNYWVQNNRVVQGYCALCDKLWNVEKENKGKSYHNVWEWFERRSDFESSGKLACSNVRNNRK